MTALVRVLRGGRFGAALCWLALTGLAPALPAPALADKYPSRPITMIVPFPPGGPSDAIARLLADRLPASLGAPVIVENRTDGAGESGSLKAAAAAPEDGYTLLFGTPRPLAIAPAVHFNLGFDPLKAFAPVAMVATSPQVLTVTPSLPAKSVHDLVVFAKSKPGKVSYASPGYGTQPHLLGALLRSTAGIDLVHVPYRGSAPAIADLLAGRVQMYFGGPGVIAPHIASGALRALAVASESRSRILPDVPTMIESGFGRFIASYWTAVVAPAGTSPQIVDRLNGAINEVLRNAEVQAQLGKSGFEAKSGTPQDAATFIAAEAAKWAVIAKAAGVRSP
jgi:tripartite-type tricarboxylate transporter receptor subunit TctC